MLMIDMGGAVVEGWLMLMKGPGECGWQPLHWFLMTCADRASNLHTVADGVTFNSLGR